MRIGLISDTHIPDHAKALPEQLKDVFPAVNLILHAGDIYDISVLDELEHIAPVLAAEGDDDPLSTSTDKRVKVKHILNIDGVTIWLTHARPWIWPADSAETPNIIVCGHTHTAAMENLKGDVLLVNPGSPTFPQYRLEPGTVALLTITAGKAEANILQLQ